MRALKVSRSRVGGGQRNWLRNPFGVGEFCKRKLSTAFSETRVALIVAENEKFHTHGSFLEENVIGEGLQLRPTNAFIDKMKSLGIFSDPRYGGFNLFEESICQLWAALFIVVVKRCGQILLKQAM